MFGFGIMAACANGNVDRPLEARAFRALLIGAASATANDTICVSVASPAGEADPPSDVLRAVQVDFPAVVPQSGCGTLSPEPPTIRLISARLLSDSTVEAVGETVGEHMRRHRCTVAKGVDVAECEYVTPEEPGQTLDVSPT
jgi:hypothetical protein